MNSLIYINKVFLTFLFVCFSQFLNSQVVISKPVLTFSYLCQSTLLNTNHQVKFSVSPISSLSIGNVFVLELSKDNFSTKEVISLSSITQSGSQFVANFTLPLNTFGTNYKLRVKASNPSVLSPGSDTFDAYFIKHNQEILLNSAVGIDNVSFCSSGNLTLFIYDTGNNSSPLFYPELTYVWKKKQLPNDLVIGTGSSISINQPGQYYVETNYGICASSFDSRSRLVTVTNQSSAPLSLSASANNFCPGQNVTLTSSYTGSSYTYKWYNGSNLISGASNSVYTTSVPGNYKVTADNGVCLAESNILALSAFSISSSINQTSPIGLSQGEFSSIVVTTNAINPTYKWYKDGVLLTESTNTLRVNSIGSYKVIVTQTSGCVTSNEIIFDVQKADTDQIPNLISPNNDGFNDTWILPRSITNLSGINLQVFNSHGKLVLNTESYLNNWPTTESDYKNSNAVFYYVITLDGNPFKEGTLTVIK